MLATEKNPPNIRRIGMKGTRDVNQQMMAEPTSESIIGLDLGDRWSRYCVIDSRGVVVKEDRVRNQSRGCRRNIPGGPAATAEIYERTK
jgi:hypothetical protein